jgi:hypothetical protein
MKYTFLIFFILCTSNLLFSQSIDLLNQRDVDNFKMDYGNPRQVEFLIIFDYPNKTINNLDSLENIEYIDLLGFFYPLDSLKSVKGLKRLKKVRDLQISLSSSDSLIFPVLDTVDKIALRNSNHTNLKLRPSYVKNIKYINRGLQLDGNIVIEDFPLFEHNSNFVIQFAKMVDLDSLNIKNNSFDIIKGFELIVCKNVNTKGIKQLNQVSIFLSDNNENCDFNIVSLIKSIHRFYYRDNLENNKFGEGFKQIHVIDTIEFAGNRTMPPFKNIFPNLLLVKDRIYIRKNADLKSIADYDNIYINRNFEDSIVIRDNKLLTNCNVDFLCQALEYIPERTIIQNNGSGCTIEEIKKYCTVKTKDVQTAKVDIYPNPADSYFSIDGLETGKYNYQLYHLDGRPISRGLIYDDHQVDITSLDQGMYLLEITSKDGRYRAVQKVVKM